MNESFFRLSGVHHAVKYLFCHNSVDKLRILVYFDFSIEKRSVFILKQQITDSVCSIRIQDGTLCDSLLFAGRLFIFSAKLQFKILL